MSLRLTETEGRGLSTISIRGGKTKRRGKAWPITPVIRISRLHALSITDEHATTTTATTAKDDRLPLSSAVDVVPALLI